MAPHTSRSISQDSDGTLVVTERRYGCYCFGLVMSVLIVAFVLIVSVVLLVEDSDIDAPALLGALLAVLFVIALIAFGFIELQRRRALARRDASANEWVRSTLVQSHVESATATAPSASGRTSWVHWAPWHSAATPTSSVSGTYVAPSAPPKGYTDYDF